jgi:hypothetical protein
MLEDNKDGQDILQLAIIDIKVKRKRIKFEKYQLDHSEIEFNKINLLPQPN